INSITDATNRVLTLTNVTSAQSGGYSVAVSNTVGAVTSDTALLSVIPGINVQIVPDVLVTDDIGGYDRIDYIYAFGDTNAWLPLVTIQITNQPQNYFDLSAIGHPQRFYRVVRVP